MGVPLNEVDHPLRPVLIVGTGRCGTLTVAEYFQRAGLDIGHEKEGVDGTVAWYRTFSADTDPWGRPVQRRAYKTILHVIREPLATIASWTFIASERAFLFVGKQLELPEEWSRMRKALAHWVVSNDRCEQLASWSFRIEDLPRRLPKLFNRVGLHLPAHRKRLLQQADKHFTHLREHPPITWEELADCDAELTAAAQRKAESFGYM